MAVTSHFYTPVFKSLANKEIDLDSDTLKVMLVDASYTPNKDAHQYKSSVTGEIAGAGYTVGGVVVGTVTHNIASGVWSFSAISASWGPPATITDARYAILYDATPGSDAARPLIGYVDFGANTSSTGSTFIVNWDPTGVGAVAVA